MAGTLPAGCDEEDPNKLMSYSLRLTGVWRL